MKRILAALMVIAGMLMIVSLVYVVYLDRRQERVDAVKVLSAARAYAHDLKEKGLVVPPTVTLQELIGLGLLHPADVSGFNGIEVSVSLTVDPSRLQDVLMRARLPDGRELVVLADGSVQGN